jgi:hypothetical protein
MAKASKLCLVISEKRNGRKMYLILMVVLIELCILIVVKVQANNLDSNSLAHSDCLRKTNNRELFEVFFLRLHISL